MMKPLRIQLDVLQWYYDHAPSVVRGLAIQEFISTPLQPDDKVTVKLNKVGTYLFWSGCFFASSLLTKFVEPALAMPTLNKNVALEIAQNTIESMIQNTRNKMMLDFGECHPLSTEVRVENWEIILKYLKRYVTNQYDNLVTSTHFVNHILGGNYKVFHEFMTGFYTILSSHNFHTARTPIKQRPLQRDPRRSSRKRRRWGELPKKSKLRKSAKKVYHNAPMEDVVLSDDDQMVQHSETSDLPTYPHEAESVRSISPDTILQSEHIDVESVMKQPMEDETNSFLPPPNSSIGLITTTFFQVFESHALPETLFQEPGLLQLNDIMVSSTYKKELVQWYLTLQNSSLADLVIQEESYLDVFSLLTIGFQSPHHDAAIALGELFVNLLNDIKMDSFDETTCNQRSSSIWTWLTEYQSGLDALLFSMAQHAFSSEQVRLYAFEMMYIAALFHGSLPALILSELPKRFESFDDYFECMLQLLQYLFESGRIEQGDPENILQQDVILQQLILEAAQQIEKPRAQHLLFFIWHEIPQTMITARFQLVQHQEQQINNVAIDMSDKIYRISYLFSVLQQFCQQVPPAKIKQDDNVQLLYNTLVSCLSQQFHQGQIRHHILQNFKLLLEQCDHLPVSKLCRVLNTCYDHTDMVNTDYDFIVSATRIAKIPFKTLSHLLSHLTKGFFDDHFHMLSMMTWTSILQNNFSDKLLHWIDTFLTKQLQLVTSSNTTFFYHDQLLKMIHQVLNVHPHKTYKLLRTTVSRFLQKHYAFIEHPVVKRICDIVKVHVDLPSPAKDEAHKEDILQSETSTPPKDMEASADFEHMTLLERRRFEIKQRQAQRKEEEERKNQQHVVEAKRKAKLKAKFNRKYHAVHREPLYQSPTRQKKIAHTPSTPSSRRASRKSSATSRKSSIQAAKKLSPRMSFASPKRGFYKKYKPQERILVKYCRDLVLNMMNDVLYGDAEKRIAQQKKLKKRQRSVRQVYQKIKQKEATVFSPKKDHMQAAKAHRQKLEAEERARAAKERQESRERARQLARRNKILKAKLKAHKERKKSKEEILQQRQLEKEKVIQLAERTEHEKRLKSQEAKKAKIKAFKEAQRQQQKALETQKRLQKEKEKEDAKAAASKYHREQKEALQKYRAAQSKATLVIQQFARMRLAKLRCVKKHQHRLNQKKLKIPKYKTIKPIEIVVFANGNRYDKGTLIRVNPKSIRRLSDLFLNLSKKVTTTGPIAKLFSPEGFVISDVHALTNLGKYVVSGGESFNYEKCPEVLIDELVERESKEHRELLRRELRSPPASRSSHRRLSSPSLGSASEKPPNH